MDVQATAFSGLTVILALGGTWLFAVAHGDSTSPYAQLMALGGVACLAGVVWLRRRG